MVIAYIKKSCYNMFLHSVRLYVCRDCSCCYYQSRISPVLVITDDGRDVDDVTALAYLVGAGVNIAGIVTTHMIPDRRALIAREYMNHLDMPDVPIGVGSIFPMSKEDEALVRYLREHTIRYNGSTMTYEGMGLVPCFPSAEEVIMGAIKKYGKDLRVAAMAPMTDLAHFAQSHPDVFSQIGGIFIQGQATVENGALVPDPQAYNIKEDEEAASTIFAWQDKIPITLVGKFAAYQVPLERADFRAFAETGNPAGKHLEDHAIKGIEAFAQRAPDIFRRVFGIDPSRLSELSELSKPYDALVAMAITDPDHFAPIRLGHHAPIGMSSENPGIINPARTKQAIIQTVLRALTRGRP